MTANTWLRYLSLHIEGQYATYFENGQTVVMVPSSKFNRYPAIMKISEDERATDRTFENERMS